MPNPILVVLLSLPFAGALLLLMLRHRVNVSPQRVALMVTGLAACVLAWLSAGWSATAVPEFHAAWMPAVGLDFSIWLDGPALFWAWLVVGIGFLVVQYAGHYMDAGDAPWRFYSVLLAFMGSMLGVVISKNLLLMFVFWEMTSLSSFLLIGHWHQRPSARQGARRALLITSLGGLSLMCGVALVGMILGEGGGDLSWPTLWEAAPRIVSHRLAPAALVLMLFGAFTKSAQFPFHVWLPGAMEAPTPVSAYLHAATMVKAGIYLLGRLYPTFGSMEIWFHLVAFVGIATMLVGGWLALVSFDLKILLAWSTVSQLGLITAFYGFGHGEIGSGEKLLTLDLLLVASHALFKAALFMLVGVIDHGCGTRDWRVLGGLGRKMRVTTALAIVGCASMAGLPFTFGFVAKKLFFESAWHMHPPDGVPVLLMYGLAVAASVLTVAYCIRMVVLTFFGRPRDEAIAAHAHEGGPGFLFAPALLCLATLAGGIYVPLLERPIALLSNSAFYGIDSHYSVAFYHLNKLDVNFWVSVLMLFVLGPLLYWVGNRMDERFTATVPPFIRHAWDYTLDKHLLKFAAFVSRTMQSPSLYRNSAVLLLVIMALVGVPLLGHTIPEATDSIRGVGLFGAASFLLFTILLTLMVLAEWEPLHRLLALGFVGLLVTGIFVAYRGPDLALTQLLVELVLLIMFLLLLPKIKAPKRFRAPKKERVLSACIALAVGVLVAGLSYSAIQSHERAQPIAEGQPTAANYYIANSKAPAQEGGHSGGGNNIVNVILVDFRGMDTLGEITVLLVAALGVGVMTRRTRQKPGGKAKAKLPEATLFTSEELAGARREFRVRPLPGQSLMMRELAPLVAMLALNLAVVLFLAGHNAPGGGFIAALMTTAALVPFFLAYQRGEPRRPEIPKPIYFLAAGILIAIATGFAPVLFGHEFLHSAHGAVHLPLIGDLEFASAAMFDLGVYILVLGISLFILKHFGKA